MTDKKEKVLARGRMNIFDLIHERDFIVMRDIKGRGTKDTYRVKVVEDEN